MPVARGRNQLAPSQGRLTKLANYIDQPAQSPQHVQGVRGCQHIKKGTTWIRGQIEPLGPQLRPRDILTSHKKQAAEKSYIQPACGALNPTLQSAHDGLDGATRCHQLND